MRGVDEMRGAHGFDDPPRGSGFILSYLPSVVEGNSPNWWK
jgi:hypothetical protein